MLTTNKELLNLMDAKDPIETCLSCRWLGFNPGQDQGRFFSVWKKIKYVLLSPRVPQIMLFLLLAGSSNLFRGDKRETNMEKS